jgi:hypothetical protein
MKDFFKHVFNQRGFKAALIWCATVVPVWTYFWSKQDGQFNVTIIMIGLCLLVVLVLCEFISIKVKQWRTGRK